jgi:predicted RNA binding protein YcfA (HicA-like mRNA interferase family)
MPKLPNIGFKKLLKVLEKAGYVVDYITGGHYILYRATDGRRVTVPFHSKDLPKGTLHSIIKSSGLPDEDFR